MTDLLPLGGLRSVSIDLKSHPEFHNGFKLTEIGTCAKKNPPPLPAAPSLPCAGTGSRVLCINELGTSCSELKLIQHTWRKSSFLTQGSRGSTTPTKSNLRKRRTQSCFTNLHQILYGENAKFGGSWISLGHPRMFSIGTALGWGYPVEEKQHFKHELDLLQGIERSILPRDKQLAEISPGI